DEMSMVDSELMYKLITAVPNGAKLILIGDADQLMSVGAGNVLRDMISSECVPTVRLSHIYRQGEGSEIVMASHSINKGEMPVLSKEGDFVFAEINSPSEMLSKLLQFFRVSKKRLEEKELFEIQVLCPSKKGELGAVNLNKELQKVLNTSAGYDERKVGDKVFRYKDKVMQIKNNYGIEWTDSEGNEDSGIFNGDMGVVSDVNSKAEMLSVRFDDGKNVQYPFADLDQLIHAYAITVHKSQGSEFDTVLIVLNAPAPLLTRNLLYTAVTRAKKKLYVLGSKETLKKMIDNNIVQRRYTNLTLYLKKEREKIK
ncbi:MAG: AAA family ATPase, partial [Clostridia bacterium]|nr:AAA family ATPase [Clostridia bacterium]